LGPERPLLCVYGRTDADFSIKVKTPTNAFMHLKVSLSILMNALTLNNGSISVIPVG
jgi:hypothetical protein